MLGDGNMEDGMWWAGQTQGLIHDVDSVENVVSHIMRDAERTIGRLPTLLRDRDGVAPATDRSQ